METALLSIEGNIQVNLSSGARSLTPPPEPGWKRVAAGRTSHQRIATFQTPPPPTLLEVGMKGNGRGWLLRLMAGSLRVALFFFNDAPVLARPLLKMKPERRRNRTGGNPCPDAALQPASSVRSTAGVSVFSSTLETDWAPSAFSPH